MRQHKSGFLLLVVALGLISACTTKQVEPAATLAPINDPAAIFTPESTATARITPTLEPTETPTPEPTEEDFVPLGEIGTLEEFLGSPWGIFVRVQADPNHSIDERLPDSPDYDPDEEPPYENNIKLTEQFQLDTYHADISLEDFCMYLRDNLVNKVGWVYGDGEDLSNNLNLYSYGDRDWLYARLGKKSGAYNCSIFDIDHPDFMPFVEFGEAENFAEIEPPQILLRDVGSKQMFVELWLYFVRIQMNPDHLPDERLPEYPEYDPNISKGKEPNASLTEQFLEDTYNTDISLYDFCLYIQNNLANGVGWVFVESFYPPGANYKIAPGGLDMNNPEHHQIFYQNIGQRLGIFSCTVLDPNSRDFMPFDEFIQDE